MHIFSIIVVIGILVFVHELGHFLAAKLFGVRVERFSIGFPPRMFGVQVGDTDYCISAIPLGGYVKLSGMIDESLDAESLNKTPEPYEFRAKPMFQKIVIITAGVIMNFLLAVAILAAMLWVDGKTYTKNTPINIPFEGGIAETVGLQNGDRIVEINGQAITYWDDIYKSVLRDIGGDYHLVVQRNGEPVDLYVRWDELDLSNSSAFRMNVQPMLDARVGPLQPGYPAEAAGLQTGDQVLAIGDSPVASWGDMTALIKDRPDSLLTFTMLRGTDTFMVDIRPRAEEVQYPGDSVMTTVGRIGIGYLADFEKVEFGLWPALREGYRSAIFIGMLNIQGFKLVLTGQVPPKDMLAGPVRIAKIASDTAQVSLTSLFELIAQLSVVLAIVNILPIPALDGGHLMIILIEGIIKKPLGIELKMRIQQIGMAILLALMLLVIYNDILSFF